MKTRCLLILAAVPCLAPVVSAKPGREPFLGYAGDSGLRYFPDEHGNRVPDFSHAGYLGGNAPIPSPRVLVQVAPAEGDDTARIQAAIDHVAAQAPGDDGLRGAVLLQPGRFEVAGQLRITTSGVTLMGSGQGDGGTQLVATGEGRRTLIRVHGEADRVLDEDRRHRVVQRYVPVNASTLELDSTAGLAAGGRVVLHWPSSEAWLESLGMEKTNYEGHLDWRPGFYDVTFDRTVTAIDGNTVTLDAPVTMVMDRELAQATVTPYAWPGRISGIGVENLELVSEHDRSHPMDEEHAWMGIVFENTENAWVRQVTGRHFVSSLVCIWESCRAITVSDCTSLEPVSEVAGYRRHTFYTAGSQTLFLRCFSEEGLHDFATGWLAAGPNAFVDCDTRLSHDFSGPIESWATGVLYDGCDIDRGGLMLMNRDRDYAGVGWAAGNCLLYNSTAARIGVYDPPGDDSNWAMGCWGLFYGRGEFRAQNEFVKPDSLYLQQLTERVGEEAAGRIGAIPGDPGTGTAVTAPAVEAVAADRIAALSNPAPPPSHPLVLTNGWLTIDGKLAVGGTMGVNWWRGKVQPQLAHRPYVFGYGVTRYVPGRVGNGFTDDLDELTDIMLERGDLALEHNMGLWYDRRRDDHQMVRRPDAMVWPPFYEVPWARSGVGRNWMQLSKYDLTKFNPWYFSRLREFADQAERKGLVLLNHHYFQHNILEAGGHWADYAWRSVNNINGTGFPEPPPYRNRKRIFMSGEFYDVTDEVRRPLHQAFVRKHLESFAGAPNVIHLIGEEFTGPESFARLWVETARDWQAGNGDEQLIAISTTRDVQEPILADPELAPTIDVINILSWHNARGGIAKAPRQQGGGGASPRQVAEYRRLHPGKAVIGDFGRGNAWELVFSGASMVDLPPLDDDAVLAAIPAMRPWQPAGGPGGKTLALADPGSAYLVWSRDGASIELDLSGIDRSFRAQWIHPEDGATIDASGTIDGGGEVTLRPPGSGHRILWLR